MKLVNSLLGVWTVLVLIFFYLPIAILIGFSFNTSRLNIVWEGFTLDWYAAIWRDAVLVGALNNSLIVRDSFRQGVEDLCHDHQLSSTSARRGSAGAGSSTV